MTYLTTRLTCLCLLLWVGLLKPYAFAGFKTSSAKDVEGEVAPAHAYPEFRKLADQLARQLLDGARSLGMTLNLKEISILESDQSNLMVDWAAGKNKQQLKVAITSRFIRNAWSEFFSQPDHKQRNFLLGVQRLGGALSHEVGHVLDPKTYDRYDSQLQESMADQHGMELLRASHLPTEWMYEAIRSLQVHSSHDRQAVDALGSSHPDHEVRLSHLRLYSTWDRFQKGARDQLPKSLDFLPLKNHSPWEQELEQFKQREEAIAQALAQKRKPTLEEFEEALKEFEAKFSQRVTSITAEYLALNPSDPNLQGNLEDLREKNADVLGATAKLLFPSARWQELASDAKKSGQDQLPEWKHRAAEVIEKASRILELRVLVLNGHADEDLAGKPGFKTANEWAQEIMNTPELQPKLLNFQTQLTAKNPMIRHAIALKDLEGFRHLQMNWSKKEREEWLGKHYFPVYGGDPGFRRMVGSEVAASYFRYWVGKNKTPHSMIDELNENEGLRTALDLVGDSDPNQIEIAKWMDAHRNELLALELGYLRPRGLDPRDFTGIEGYHFPWKKVFQLVGKDPEQELKLLGDSARKLLQSKDFWKNLQRAKRGDRRQRYDPFLAAEKSLNRERLPLLAPAHEYTNGLQRVRTQAGGKPFDEKERWLAERLSLGPGYDFKRPEWVDTWAVAPPVLDPRLDLKWNGKEWTGQPGMRLEVDDAAIRETLGKTPDRFYFMLEEFKNPLSKTGRVSRAELFPRQMGENCSVFQERLSAWEQVRKRWNFNYSPLFWKTLEYGDTIFWEEQKVRTELSDRQFFEEWLKQGNLSDSQAAALAQCLIKTQAASRKQFGNPTPNAREVMHWIADRGLIPLEAQMAALKESDSRLYETIEKKHQALIERQVKEFIGRSPPAHEFLEKVRPFLGSPWNPSPQSQELLKRIFAELLQDNRLHHYSREDQVLIFEQLASRFEDWAKGSPSALSDQFFQNIFSPDFDPPRPRVKPFERLEFKHFPGPLSRDKLKDWLKRGFFFNPLLYQELARFLMDEEAQKVKKFIDLVKEGEPNFNPDSRKLFLTGFFKELDELYDQPSQEKDDLLEKYAWEFQILDPGELKELVTSRKISQYRVSNPSNRSGMILNLVSGLARTLSNWNRAERAEAFKAMIDPMDEAAFRNLAVLLSNKASRAQNKLESDLDELQKIRAYLQKSSPIQRLPLIELLLSSGREPLFGAGTSLADPLLETLIQTYLKYDPTQMKILGAYLRSIPDHEKGPALAYLFSMFQKKGDGMKSMFEIFSTVGVKTGQLISIWKFFGEKVSEELGDLKGDAQPINQMDMEALLDTLRTQLGHEEFSRIESIRPLGSASLKTVLQLQYKNGHMTKVAHIHRPFAKAVVQSNLVGARRFLRELHQEGFEKEARALEMLLLVVEEQLKDEQNPALENIKTAKAGIHYGTFQKPRLIEAGPARGWKISVPQFYSESEHTKQVKATHVGTEPDVHLMEFAEGITLASARNPKTQAKYGITQEELAQANFLAVDMALDSLFKSGEMNADGHTANYLANFKKKELYPIDFGQFEMGKASRSQWLRDDPYQFAQLLQVFAAVPHRPEAYSTWNNQQKENFWRPWCLNVLTKVLPLARNQTASERDKQDFLHELLSALLQNPSVDPKMMVTSTLLKSALNPRKEIFGFLKGLLVLSEEHYVPQEVFQTLLAQKIKTLYLEKLPCTAADAAAGFCSQVWEKCVEKASEALKAVEVLNLGERVKACF